MLCTKHKYEYAILVFYWIFGYCIGLHVLTFFYSNRDTALCSNVFLVTVAMICVSFKYEYALGADNGNKINTRRASMITLVPFDIVLNEPKHEERFFF